MTSIPPPNRAATDPAGLPLPAARVDVLWPWPLDDRDQIFSGLVVARSGLRVTVHYDDGDRFTHDLNDLTWRLSTSTSSPAAWHDPGDAHELLRDVNDASFSLSVDAAAAAPLKKQQQKKKKKTPQRQAKRRARLRSRSAKGIDGCDVDVNCNSNNPSNIIPHQSDTKRLCHPTTNPSVAAERKRHVHRNDDASSHMIHCHHHDDDDDDDDDDDNDDNNDQDDYITNTNAHFSPIAHHRRHQDKTLQLARRRRRDRQSHTQIQNRRADSAETGIEKVFLRLRLRRGDTAPPFAKRGDHDGIHHQRNRRASALGKRKVPPSSSSCGPPPGDGPRAGGKKARVATVCFLGEDIEADEEDVGHAGATPPLCNAEEMKPEGGATGATRAEESQRAATTGTGPKERPGAGAAGRKEEATRKIDMNMVALSMDMDMDMDMRDVGMNIEMECVTPPIPVDRAQQEHKQKKKKKQTNNNKGCDCHHPSSCSSSCSATPVRRGVTMCNASATATSSMSTSSTSTTTTSTSSSTPVPVPVPVPPSHPSAAGPTKARSEKAFFRASTAPGTSEERCTDINNASSLSAIAPPLRAPMRPSLPLPLASMRAKAQPPVTPVTPVTPMYEYASPGAHTSAGEEEEEDDEVDLLLGLAEWHGGKREEGARDGNGNGNGNGNEGTRLREYREDGQMDEECRKKVEEGAGVVVDEMEERMQRGQDSGRRRLTLQDLLN